MQANNQLARIQAVWPAQDVEPAKTPTATRRKHSNPHATHDRLHATAATGKLATGTDIHNSSTHSASIGFQLASRFHHLGVVVLLHRPALTLSTSRQLSHTCCLRGLSTTSSSRRIKSACCWPSSSHHVAASKCHAAAGHAPAATPSAACDGGGGGGICVSAWGVCEEARGAEGSTEQAMNYITISRIATASTHPCMRRAWSLYNALRTRNTTLCFERPHTPPHTPVAGSTVVVMRVLVEGS